MDIQMSETADIRIESFGLDRDTIHRWRRRLNEREKYRERLYGAVYAKTIASRPRDGVSRPHTAGSSRRPRVRRRRRPADRG